ncbi:MAG: hypothetical protein NTV33_09935 [Coprothermobacterota bacterium]|nr:hypothetical protein [Coprothermobacterota bacterium]
MYSRCLGGNERKEIYRDARDRSLFLDLLRQVNQRTSWLCHAHCLMDNHCHLLIETPEPNLSPGLLQLSAWRRRDDASLHYTLEKSELIQLGESRNGISARASA